jgi:hypothetical protein
VREAAPIDAPRGVGALRATGWGTRVFVAVAFVTSSVVLAVLVATISATGVGGDGPVYAQMERHPFETANLGGPYPFRILGPLVVWALPLPTEAGFHFISVVGLLGGAMVTALLARRLHVPDLLAVLAPILYLASFAGIYNVHQYRMLDAFSSALTAVALLAAWDRRAVVFGTFAVLATAAKEMGVLLPFAWAATEWTLD